MVTGGNYQDGDKNPTKRGASRSWGTTVSGQSVSTSGTVGSPSSPTELAMATPATENNTFLRLNHLDIQGDDAGSQGAVGNKKKKRGQRAVGGDKSGRGLCQFSMKVCEKVESKGRTTYNEVSWFLKVVLSFMFVGFDELVAEFADPRSSVASPDQQYDEKNIRRRVYDALNVLMAMDILSKDKKEIQWKGLPRTSLSDIEDLKFVGFQNLIQRNEQLYSSGNAPSGCVALPFILVQTRPHATVEVEISEDMQLVHFDFNSTPFELHDDNYVLKAMKFCERPKSDETAHNFSVDGDSSSMSAMYQQQILPPTRTSTPGRPPASPPLPGILKAHKPSIEQPPKLELKQLPEQLKYAYLGNIETLPVIISSKLQADQEERLIATLQQHKEALGWTIADIKGISPTICMHKILLDDNHKPTVDVQRRLNQAMKDVVRKEILKWLDAGIIYPISDSEWVSPVQCVPKKGGMTVISNEKNELIPTRTVTGWRVCMDYRKLNKATRKYHFPLPFIDQMLDRLAEKQFYCFLDGYSSYNQIAIAPEDQSKTTFTCPYGTFAFRRMPFWLCNAPATFQRCMTAIFSDLNEDCLKIFMDDFSTFGEDFEKCLSNLEKVLKTCKETNLVLNWEKCHFMVDEGIVLDHKISSKGMEVDKAKIEVISKLPPLTTVKGIRSFLCHAGFHRRFIEDFSKITKPLCSLLEQGRPFEFNNDCTKAFNLLKQKLVTAPIVEPPDWKLPFELMCDASDYAVGAVLG
ncbi:hypothetical protein GQ457_13G012970 [Hibiscus cannabinus]